VQTLLSSPFLEAPDGIEVTMHRRLPILMMLGLSGCLPLLDNSTTQVSFNPFGNPTLPAEKRQVSYAPASQELAQRVDFIGSQLCAFNPQIGRPFFMTIGSPAVEIFHKDNIVYVTAGLVEKCNTPEELAAVLSVELGKIVSEREAQVNPATRSPDVPPPISMPIGNSQYAGNTDLTYLAEIGKYEKEHPRHRGRLPRPDPQLLAAHYLESAGYQKAAIDAVQPLLKAAEQNCALERQMSGVPRGNWTP
jgi:hypothetical protein